ncbi:hypothetical protein TGPRC2_227335 [Toxoplasma gondii TgCatPRC2]|uniref:Uncharacterized protein n=15 Tax=Toxoplasma gondii TaxID=5811 RepID=A0A125YYS5_TOXGV|nr:hypothetical protein TGME49_227335 [Toxoplasma gondii ME49]EPR62298.1 hypothetical protein TGGT1_227335 [Toxoplasma gondii GT1]ESS32684.1 hypothetical protein TGVEG_227335 [Toxoplasma gondii VEG]KAF4640759.1 hypothetical protein TGRH88_046850 [Toxoplasma gondii]KFG42372.1 hypothetical protein TGP89_227335 [Toxoplasma gondii p89]KFG45155.1 hypothetical protein TGDOM2_227335 [Toxoplasma gondii GAB2-2007-GAL-DOM2]KFG51969.1 hypothetical protein TGFOU_227335 [Toxoplasma gondii FOU]KFG61004.1 |eukprot:XP_018636064.1 hypothetical protein TGME49_227335 [Toxoplasma gondii ME49]
MQMHATLPSSYRADYCRGEMAAKSASSLLYMLLSNSNSWLTVDAASPKAFRTAQQPSFFGCVHTSVPVQSQSQPAFRHEFVSRCLSGYVCFTQVFSRVKQIQATSSASDERSWTSVPTSV